MFNKHHNQLSGSVNNGARYLLFTSIWTIAGSSFLVVFFMLFAGALTSVAVHLA
jgi:hypothetical protein